MSGIVVFTQFGENAFLYAVVLFVIILTGIIALFVCRRIEENRKSRALTTSQVDNMDHLDFEVYVGRLLKQQGYTNIRLTERYDLGVDVIATKAGVTWGVQVKHYTRIVKAEAVRQVVTALVQYKCDRAMVVTNSFYSRPAKVLAADNKCVLIDRDTLASWIADYQNK